MAKPADGTSTTMTLEITASGYDAEELEQMAGQLRNELLELGVDDVERLRAGQAPPGAKGLDAAIVGTLVLQLPCTAAALAEVVQVVRAWLRRSGDRTVTVTVAGDSIKLTGVSSDDQHRRIKQWVDGHASR